MKKFACLLLVSFSLTSLVHSQTPDPLRTSFIKLQAAVTKTDRNDSMLLSPMGLNVFLQRKTLQYLTGASDLSLAKFYAAYNTDNDKLNLGLNFPLQNRYTQLLRLILNPILEADVKKNFSKLYEGGKWQNNIRGGLKLTWLTGTGSLGFWKKGATKFRKPDFMILRTKTYNDLHDAYVKKYTKITNYTLLGGGTTSSTTPADLKPYEIKRKEKELFEKMGIAEADYLEQERAYTRFQSTWLSIWGFTPLSPAEYYLSPGRPVPFTKTRYRLWELNVQGTHLHDWKNAGTLYATVGLKRFQNNSANADLMTGVDLNQYNAFPATGDTLNYSQIGTNKAYTGAYKEFMSTSLYLQGVYFPPVQWVVKPGVSFRYEKNWGDWSPANMRFGLPITIQGKEKPITIELQYRLTDIGNYRNQEDFEVKKTLGISLGLPIVLLYK